MQAERVVDILKPLGGWKVEPNGTYAVDENGAQVFVEYAAPEHVPPLMAEVLDCVNATHLRPDDAGEAAPAYARIHAGFVSIHPFWDGNGRLARLVANIPLLAAGLPPLVIPKEDRRQYIDILARYQRRIGRITPETGVWPDPPNSPRSPTSAGAATRRPASSSTAPSSSSAAASDGAAQVTRHSRRTSRRNATSCLTSATSATTMYPSAT